MITAKFTFLIIAVLALAIAVYYHQRHSQKENCLFCRNWGTMISLGTITTSLLLKQYA